MNKEDNLPKLGGIITLIDCSIAFAAGLLIIPAVFIAQKNGMEIYDQAGNLFAGPDLIFQILPKLFGTMGTTGLVVSFFFWTNEHCCAYVFYRNVGSSSRLID